MYDFLFVFLFRFSSTGKICTQDELYDTATDISFTVFFFFFPFYIYFFFFFFFCFVILLEALLSYPLYAPNARSVTHQRYFINTKIFIGSLAAIYYYFFSFKYFLHPFVLFVLYGMYLIQFISSFMCSASNHYIRALHSLLALLSECMQIEIVHHECGRSTLKKKKQREK